MPVKLLLVRSLMPLFLLVSWAAASTVLMHAQTVSANPPSLTAAEAQELVDRALTAELRIAQDPNHPMRYRLRKSSPRFTSTKEIFETRDGDVARLVAIGDKPLSPTDEQMEQDRLDLLLSDPSRQRHRKQSEDEDTVRALKVLRALPQAFVYQLAGTASSPAGKVVKFTFKPNPNFIPPDLETDILTAMTGELWIDPTQERVTRLEGHLQRDVNFGWGILGQLSNGGWIVIEQADVGARQWRIVRFQMAMSGRVLFKNRVFDTLEEQTQFAPVPVGLTYAQAIQMLRANPGAFAQPSH